MRKAPTNTTELGKLRIIGGQWRGRKLSFPVADGLRPTGDRIRETLFNWLAPEIEGAHCLDLFAGSGALGLEALSRGAASCTFIESNRLAADAIRDHLRILNCAAGTVVEASALTWLEHDTQRFDIIFIDPPFSANLYQPSIQALEQQGKLKAGGKLYLEFDVKQAPAPPTSLSQLRDKKAGNTAYQLYGKDR
ncbi:MAG: 16S rRNA (guanine966-N2)-methyltransferase [Bacteroidia bacterium]|jgi:16S rRNA (guanine966-N2)-methyltransferase